MAGFWTLEHIDVPDQQQHQVPDQFEAVRQFCKDGGWEPYAVMPFFGPEGPGGTTQPMVRHWLKKFVNG